jgi:hypothetical protein
MAVTLVIMFSTAVIAGGFNYKQASKVTYQSYPTNEIMQQRQIGD